MSDIILRVEPSTRLSEILGRPYFIERRFSVEKLLSARIINKRDIEQMKLGKEICKKIKVEV